MENDYLWNKEGIPHKGWECIGTFDSMEINNDYQICEMCGKESIRFIHIMHNDLYHDDLEVGCICAGKMEGDYLEAKNRETNMKNRLNRKNNFLKKVWTKKPNGNLTLKYKGRRLTIFKSNFKNVYGIAYQGSYIYEYKDEDITTIEKAKLAAFDFFDSFKEEEY